eukprot:GGOE01005518.1.p1 GENE.GGOE01005518.1~~GGOE01005518.1.p1  ORF type:complete len:286 (-),score=80.73 GGOE01005518.1:253-1110(-)
MDGDAGDSLEVARSVGEADHTSKVDPIPTIPVSKRTRDIAVKVFDCIADLLDPEEETLWRAFLESDLSFDGKLYSDEFLSLLKRFLVDGAPQGSVMEAFLQPGLDNLEFITFSNIVHWWAQRKSQPNTATQALQTALQSHPPTIRWKKLLGSDETELRLAQMTERAVRHTVRVYSVLLYHLKANRMEVELTDRVVQEAGLRDKAKEISHDDPEDYELRGAFTFCTGDLTTPLPQCQLGNVCGVLGFDPPWSLLQLTRKCYLDPMPYEEFREWWLVHSGRAHSWFF